MARCPAISPPDCSEHTIPAHMHHQVVHWLRLGSALSVGLGKGWQLQAEVPVDLKWLTVDYTDLDGQTYAPPYAGIHHRNETLFGPTDATLWGQRYQGFSNGLVIGLSVGSSLPIAKTEEDPFALGLRGLEHQHFQRGTGTFVPKARAECFWFGMRWLAMGWASGQLPLYENPRGYQPGRSVAYGLTGGYRLTPDTRLLAVTQAGHDGAEAWNGNTSNSPPRDLLMVGGLVTQVVSPGVVLQGQVRGTAWQRTRGRDSEDQLIQRVIIGLGLSWTPGGEQAD